MVLLGTLDKGGLAEYLQGPHFQVDVHDRDRKIERKKPKPSLFGENPEDEMINNVSLVAGMRTRIACYVCHVTNIDCQSPRKRRSSGHEKGVRKWSWPLKRVVLVSSHKRCKRYENVDGCLCTGACLANIKHFEYQPISLNDFAFVLLPCAMPR